MENFLLVYKFFEFSAEPTHTVRNNIKISLSSKHQLHY